MTYEIERIGIFGAGAIGVWLGTHLSRAGVPVTLIGRRSLVDARDRILALDGRGQAARLADDAVVTEDPDALADVDLCLVTVKARDHEATGRLLYEVLTPDTPVLTLQNGLDNHLELGRHIGHDVHAGSVGFNVARSGPDGMTFQRRVAGAVHLAERPPLIDELAAALVAAGVDVQRHAAIRDALAGKLLVNTNNGVCGATGLGIHDMLHDADARWVFAECIKEGRAVLAADGYRPAKVTKVGPPTLAMLLHLPTPVFSALLEISGKSPVDEEADTSTMQDLRRGRATEIDRLNGAIASLGRDHGIPTPANAVVTRVVHEHEKAIAEGRTPNWRSSAQLRLRCENERRLAAARVR
jgi:2-dehydropantoate 2-reductase